MPTDLPPDYVPQPPKDPDSPQAPGQGMPGGKGGMATPGKGVDVVDPTGWAEPPAAPGDVPAGVPSPAGTPTF